MPQEFYRLEVTIDSGIDADDAHLIRITNQLRNEISLELM